MKPAPPVIIIFLTSGNGSNFVVPVRIGASFQMPRSSKILEGFVLVAATPTFCNQQNGSASSPSAISRLTSSIGGIVCHGEAVFSPLYAATKAIFYSVSPTLEANGGECGG